MRVKISTLEKPMSVIGRLDRPHAGNTLERLHFEKGCRCHAAVVAVVVDPLAKPMLLCTVMNRNLSQILRQTKLHRNSKLMHLCRYCFSKCAAVRSKERLKYEKGKMGKKDLPRMSESTFFHRRAPKLKRGPESVSPSVRRCLTGRPTMPGARMAWPFLRRGASAGLSRSPI